MKSRWSSICHTLLGEFAMASTGSGHVISLCVIGALVLMNSLVLLTTTILVRTISLDAGLCFKVCVSIL